ncbi:MAG: ABC transporter ATP-binding protein [Planctomycetota bacterium]
MLGATALLLIASGIGLAVPLVAGRVVDTALSEATTTDLYRIVGGLMGLFAALGVVGYFENYLLGAAGARLLRDLRGALFTKLVGLTPTFYDQRRVGELLSRLGSDLTVVQGALAEQIPGGVQATLRFIGTLGVLLFLQPRLTLVALVVVPPVVLVAMYFGQRLERNAKDARDATAETSALAEESLAGIRTVQAHTAEPWVLGRYRARLSELLEVQLRNARLNAAFAGAVSFAAFSAFAIVLGYGGQLMLEGRLSPGDLTSFLLYTFSVAISVGQLGGLYAGYRQLQGASARVFELLDTEPAIADPDGALPFEVSRGALALRDVRYRYAGADRDALAGVSLDITGGSVVAFVGPSGSGKSTLFALLMRFYAQSAGTLALDGRPLASIALADLRRAIGVVPQEIFLFSGTISDNLRLGADGNARDVSQTALRAAAAAAGALEFIERLPQGFETEVGERGVRLSAGQRQRLAIARAFLADPRVLLLDEATSALDPDSEATVQGALERLFAGRTTLVIAHRLATARRADVIHVLEDGRIAASGTHDELFAASELYRRYWSLQSLGVQGVDAALGHDPGRPDSRRADPIGDAPGTPQAS